MTHGGKGEIYHKQCLNAHGAPISIKKQINKKINKRLPDL